MNSIVRSIISLLFPFILILLVTDSEHLFLHGKTFVPKHPPDTPTRWLEWTSHVHEFHEFNEIHEGIVFGPAHDIWDFLEEGDLLVFKACARFGWRNIVDGGGVRFWEKFDPSALG